MAEYAIPLSLLMQAGFPFDLLPVGSPPFDLLVRKIRQSWNDTHFVVTGELVLGTDLPLFDLKIFEILFGHGSSGEAVLRFEFASARMSIASVLASRGEELFGLDESVLESEDTKFQVFWQADGPCPSFRLSVHDIAARIRLPERFLKGEVIENEENEVTGIEALHPPQRVDFTVVSASLYVDTERGISLELDPSQAIDIPPFLIGDSGVGIQIETMKLDFSGETGIPEVLSRPTYDESWKGVYIEKARLLGLDGWIPFFPERVELSKWLLDGDGITGAVKLDPTGGVGVLGPFELESVELELERNNFVRGVFETRFHWGALNEDWSDWHDLLVTFTLRYNPGIGPGAVGFDISIKSIAEDPDGLFTISKELIARIEAGLAGAILGAFALGAAEPTAGRALTAGVLSVVAVLEATGKLTIEEVKVVKATARYFSEEIDGELQRFVDVALDFRGRISLDLPLGSIPIVGSILPNIKTDRPIGFEVRGFTVRFHGLDTPEIVFDPKSGISFDVGEQTLIKGSPFLITKAGIGKWDQGIWLDLGLGYAKDTNKLAVSVDAIRFWFLDDGSIDHVSFLGLSFSLLIPPSAYVKGKFEWGETVRLGTGRAYLCRKKMDDHEDRANWLWDLEVALREETVDGVTSVVASLEMTNSDGWPIGSWALYGISALLGMNSRPAVLNPAEPDYVQWYREQPPANRIIATKWTLEDGSEAAAFGVVIGSADGGRAWSAKAAIIYSSGVIIIPGSLNILSDRPKLSDDGHAALDMVLVADWEHDIYAVSIRFDYKKPADGKILHVHVPIDLYWRKSPKTWHAWVGQHMPVEKRVGAKFLTREASFYFMLDRESIPNLGGTVINVPGTAKVIGGSAGFNTQFGKGKVKAFMRAGLEFHLALGEVPNSGGPNDGRTFFGGALHLFGGLGVKVFGMGFEFVIDASILLLTPEPSLFELSLLFKIGLPWPIPDIKFTINWTKGADGPLREPGHLCAGLSLHQRSRNAPIELKEGELQTGVPIDPALTLTFTYPVRNAATSVGSFNFDSVDTTVDWAMSGEKGYAVELEDLRLFVEGPGGALTPVPGPFPAIWLDAGDPAPGGKPSRKILQLFAYDGVMASRYIGATADYVHGMFEDFDPCSAKPPKEVCYQYGELNLGPLTAPTSVGVSGDDRRLAVAVLPELPGAETVRRYAGLEASGTTVEDMAFLPARVIMLPATHGRNLPGPSAEPLCSERLELGWQRARNAELSVLRIERDTRVVVRFFDGDQLVLEDIEGVVVGTVLGKLQDVRYRCDVPTTRAEVFAFQYISEQQQQAGDPVSQTTLYRVCLLYEADWRDWEDGEATAEAWSNLWSDLFNSNAATSDALLLEPGRRYTLEAKLRWYQVDGTTETPGGTQTHSFPFQTVPADQPPLERLRPAELMVAPNAWDIDTTPGNGAAAHYRDRGITLRMRDPRLDALYKAFGRRLVLRVVNDRGEDLFDRLAFIAEHGTELPEYQEVFRDIVLGTACANGAHTSLWSIGVAHFGSLLEVDRGYDAYLVPVPDPSGTVDLSTVDWDPLPVLHSFRFRTSRWSSLSGHLDAHVLLDEILDGLPDLGGINASPASLWDDAALDEALHVRLGAVPRPPAAVPEIVRLWRPAGGGATMGVVGVLIDGPEPILRQGTTVTLRDASSTPVPLVLRAARSGTRALLLFPSPALGSAPGGTLTLSINDGVESTEAAIEVGVEPAFLAAEMAP